MYFINTIQTVFAIFLILYFLNFGYRGLTVALKLWCDRGILNHKFIFNFYLMQNYSKKIHLIHYNRLTLYKTLQQTDTIQNINYDITITRTTYFCL